MPDRAVMLPMRAFAGVNVQIIKWSAPYDQDCPVCGARVIDDGKTTRDVELAKDGWRCLPCAPPIDLGL